MLTQEWPDPEDRYPQGREENNENDPGRRGELLVAGGATSGQASARTRRE